MIDEDKNEPQKPCLFLDRDGVVIKEKHYISKAKDVEICPGIQSIIKDAMKNSWRIVIVTNQSGISRGLFKWSDYEEVTAKMLSLLKGCEISGIYANGYSPENKNARWRKPNPSMLFKACEELQLDIRNSIIIGDRISDIQAGARASLKAAVHVLSKHGEIERPQIFSLTNKNGYFIDTNNKIKVIMIDSLINFPFDLLKGTKTIKK